MKRIALYARVSTSDRGQTNENQFLALRTACQQRGWEIVIEEMDVISGTKERRPGLQRLFDAAVLREFDILFVWSLDRLTREGAFRALEIIQNLSRQGIGFESLQEPHFSTCGPFADALLAISATLAKMERERIVERVKAGLERTRKKGTILGRPKIGAKYQKQILAMDMMGLKSDKIANELPILISPRTVRRVLRQNKVAA
jgi:DNA invertase Pin-like site-specific DNA recombinase